MAWTYNLSTSNLSDGNWQGNALTASATVVPGVVVPHIALPAGWTAGDWFIQFEPVAAAEPELPAPGQRGIRLRD